MGDVRRLFKGLVCIGCGCDLEDDEKSVCNRCRVEALKRASEVLRKHDFPSPSVVSEDSDVEE